MEHIKVLLVDWLPGSVAGFTSYYYDEGCECFTIFLNAGLAPERIASAYDHEMAHINARDFSALQNVNALEERRHA